MSESFSIASRLTISTNAETVIEELIEGFTDLDKRVKSTEEVLNAFGRTFGRLSEESGGLREALRELKLPEGIQAQFSDLTKSAKDLGLEVRAVAKAWREVAEASRDVKGPQMPSAAQAEAGAAGLTEMAAENRKAIAQEMASFKELREEASQVFAGIKLPEGIAVEVNQLAAATNRFVNETRDAATAWQNVAKVVSEIKIPAAEEFRNVATGVAAEAREAVGPRSPEVSTSAKRSV